jgi:uncharacterized protein (DUF885 family)
VAQADQAVMDQRLLEFLDRAFDEQIALSPQTLTSLGIKRDYGRLRSHTSASAAMVSRRGHDTFFRTLDILEPQAPRQTGAWNMPRGGPYHAHQLQQMTTTDLSADVSHQIGLEQVARIQRQMETITSRATRSSSIRILPRAGSSISATRRPSSTRGWRSRRSVSGVCPGPRSRSAP